MKLIPISTACRRTLTQASSSSILEPKLLVPRPTAETCSPELPSLRYSICYLLLYDLN